MANNVLIKDNLAADHVTTDEATGVYARNVLTGAGAPVADPPVPEKAWVYVNLSEAPAEIYVWVVADEEWVAAGGGEAAAPGTVISSTGAVGTLVSQALPAAPWDGSFWSFGVSGASDWVVAQRDFTIPNATGASVTGIVTVRQPLVLSQLASGASDTLVSIIPGTYLNDGVTPLDGYAGQKNVLIPAAATGSYVEGQIITHTARVTVPNGGLVLNTVWAGSVEASEAMDGATSPLLTLAAGTFHFIGG